MKRITSCYRNYGDNVTFSIDENSQLDDFADAVLCCAFAKTGKFVDTTDEQKADALDLGPRLLAEARHRFGQDAPRQIVGAIAVTMLSLVAALQQKRDAVKQEIEW